MKLIYLKSALKCDSFDVDIGIKIPFFRLLVTTKPGRSLPQFVITNCLITLNFKLYKHKRMISGRHHFATANQFNFILNHFGFLVDNTFGTSYNYYNLEYFLDAAKDQ